LQWFDRKYKLTGTAQDPTRPRILDLVQGARVIEAKANETIDQMVARGIQPVGVAQYDDHNQRRLT